jgi:hypothetical protein
MGCTPWLAHESVELEGLIPQLTQTWAARVGDRFVSPGFMKRGPERAVDCTGCTGADTHPRGANINHTPNITFSLSPRAVFDSDINTGFVVQQGVQRPGIDDGDVTRLLFNPIGVLEPL